MVTFEIFMTVTLLLVINSKDDKAIKWMYHELG